MHRQTEPHEARHWMATTLLRCALPALAVTTVLSCAATSPSPVRSPSEEAAAVERAVSQCVASMKCTQDVGGSLSTGQAGDAVVERLDL